MQRDLIHHGMFPDASSPSGEHVGESYGEAIMQGVVIGSPEGSCLTSSSSEVSNQMDDEQLSTDTSWTDDKHSSYLSSMEEMFVRNMYDREYCAMDICGETAASSCSEDCVESKLPSNFSKIMQCGGWQPFPCRRLHSWELPSPTVFSTPWIPQQHDVEKPKLMERILCRTSTAYELEDDKVDEEEDDDEDDDDVVAEVPDVETRPSSWFVNRINSHSGASSTTSNRSPATDDDTGRDGSSSSAEFTHPSRRSGDTVDQVVPLMELHGQDWSHGCRQRMNVGRRR